MSFYLALDNIRSAQNVGSILRTADAARVDKVYLCGLTPEHKTEKVKKTALGAEKTLDIEYKKSTYDLVKDLKKDNISIISLELSHKSEQYNKITYPQNLCLIVGNEVTGINEEILKLSDLIVEIPMRGTKNSLNVSVATGIAIYEISNQLNKS